MWTSSSSTQLLDFSAAEEMESMRATADNLAILALLMLKFTHRSNASCFVYFPLFNYFESCLNIFHH